MLQFLFPCKNNFGVCENFIKSSHKRHHIAVIKRPVVNCNCNGKNLPDFNLIFTIFIGNNCRSFLCGSDCKCRALYGNDFKQGACAFMLSVNRTKVAYCCCALFNVILGKTFCFGNSIIFFFLFAVKRMYLMLAGHF